MKKTLFSFFSFLILSTAFFAGCEIEKNSDTSLDNEAISVEKKLEVITSFYPLAFLATEVAGKYANISNLADKKDIHSYTLSPQDMAKLSKADLVIYQGVNLETWTEDVIPELQEAGVGVLEISHDLKLLEKKKHDEDEDEHYEEEHHDEHEEEKHEEEEHHEEDGHEEHNHGAFDPHTWLDPMMAKEMSASIAQELAEIDPENAEEYMKNMNMLHKKLDELDMKYTSALASCQQEALVSHNAFGYLEARYGFKLHPIAGLSPNDEPSAKLLSELQNIANTEELTHMLTEENNVKKYAKMLSSETGLIILPINPMGTTPKDGYFETSHQNIESLVTALKCQ